MLKALARKELRELLPLVLLGVAIELLLASSAAGIRTGISLQPRDPVPSRPGRQLRS